MAEHIHHPGTLLGQDTDFDSADQPGTAQPYTQTEVEDLLYGQDRPASERLARLRELRDESAVRESGDWGNQDPASLLEEVDRAIEELSTTMGNANAGADYANLAAPLDGGQGDRLDTLAPDDYEAREAIEQGSVPDDAAQQEAEQIDEAAEDLDSKDGAD